MTFVTHAAIRRLKEHPDWSLLAAIVHAQAFRLASARFLLIELRSIVPSSEWENIKGADAIAALELADP